ncbi:hypothetical protein D0Z07_0698 [Hyphodiscus hymeniophilus]|uniref:Uncharacterized protein n=1 Tax=Hyphodiscus hymeniophilus TaxID=353542 RepID=A0A9P6VS63_9HELO|nr:hypothetical protein D0Z07_0698 [Hyphodiscus hymeniophilus]
MQHHLSSPDPLNDSPTFQSPERTRRTSRGRHSLPLASSPTKQTFELDVGDQISPQKIRVTVEAGHSDTENRYTHYVEGTRLAGTSPSRPLMNRRRERTVTTTVPVKGLSDSEDEVQPAITPKRGRGRPRKSTGTPVPAKNPVRAGTPTGKNTRRRKSIGDLVDGDDEEDYDLQIGNGVQLGRGKGRSRSRSIKATSRKSTPATTDTQDMTSSGTKSKKGRGRRKSLLPDEVVVLEDENEENPEPESAELDIDGLLQPIYGDDSHLQSAFSTIRSTTTNGIPDPDIVIARFDPGNETPRMTGWSSPRAIEPSLASNRAFEGYPSPSVSPEKHQEEQSVTTASPEQHGTSQADHVEDKYEEEGEDELDEMLEFDTVLESEGFSMISVDSVPSLREHLSSPVNQAEKPSLAPGNGKMDPLKKSATDRDRPFSSIPSDAQAATPASKFQNKSLLSVHNSRVDDSFSSIPPEVLDAASPAKKRIITNLQSRRGSGVEDSYSRTHEVLGSATLARDVLKTKALHPNNSQVYEDSFSAVPSAVLEAATPVPTRHAPLLLRPENPHASTASNRLSIPALRRPTPSGRNSTNPATARLLTPEETPSPSADSPAPPRSTREKAQAEGLLQARVERLTETESSIHSHLRSSPPSIAPRRYTYTAHLRQRRELNPDITQTPSIVFSSPSLPPPIHAARGPPVLPVQTTEIERSGLSPIARAGRALQDVVGPTLSPRARAHSLGSPFKSPVADRKSSSSIAPPNLSPTQVPRANPLPRSNVVGTLFPNPWDSIRHHDDPFSNNGGAGQQARPTPNKVYILGLPEQRRLSDPRISTIRSEGNSVLSDDAMSWQAEEEVAADDATTSVVNNINSFAGYRGSSIEPNSSSAQENMRTSEQRRAAERDAVRKQVESAGTSQVIVIDSDEDVLNETEAEEDDEDFGLLLETLNSSSPAVQQPQDLASDKMERPRRSKIPSPWRKNSKRLVYSDELSHLSSPPAASRISFGKGLINKDAYEADNSLELSSIIIPDKPNFKPRAWDSGNLDLSAVLASSPTKTQLPVLTKTSETNTSHPQEARYIGASSSGTDESRSGLQQRPFAPIPQKVGFNPRLRDPSKADASSIFGSSPLKSNMFTNDIFGVHQNKGTVVHNPTPELSSSSTAPMPLGLSSPSRSNSFRIPLPKNQAQLSESECSYDSSLSPSGVEKENQSVNNRTLKWTETVRLASVQIQPLVSPTKSCLRSPLKTPSSGSGSGTNGANTSPSKNVAFVSSSPVPLHQ